MIGDGYLLHRIKITGLTTNADNAVFTPGAGLCAYVHSGMLVFAGTGTIAIKSDVGGGAVALTGNIAVGTNGVTGLAFSRSRVGHFGTAAGKALNIALGSGVTGCEGFLNIFTDAEAPTLT